jgi:hypothetical protein
MITGRLRAGAINGVHDLVVKHQDDSSASSTKDVGQSALEEATSTFSLHDLLEAVSHARVDLLGLGLGGLNLQTTLHGVEGVRDDTGEGHSGLRDDELRGDGEGGGLLLERVEGLQDISETELGTTVHDDTHTGGTDTVVEGEEATLLDGLDEAVTHTGVLFDGTKIGTEDGTNVDQRVHQGVGSTTGSGTTSDLGHSELAEVGVLVVLGEELLDVVLERKVEGGSRDVTDAVSDVSAPQRGGAELLNVAGGAVHHTGVALHLAGDDTGVGVLILDRKLYLLKGCGDGLGDGTGDTTGGEVDEGVLVFLRHFDSAGKD